MEMPYHLISAVQLTPGVLTQYFERATRYEKYLREGVRDLGGMRGMTSCSLFYEESLRTRFSFERAAHIMGANVIGTEDARKFSSASKGESLEDTIRVICNVQKPHLRYAEIIVLRHPEKGAAERAAAVSTVPIINAGDGFGEHPTQAMIDAFAIKKTLKRLSDFHITFCGDLRYSRVISSNVYILSQYPNIEMSFVAPFGFELPEAIKEFLKRKGIKFNEANELRDVAEQSNIIYVVRVQKNRLPEEFQKKTEFSNFHVTKEIYEMTEKTGTIFLHPMPIDETEQEIRPEVKMLPRVRIFEQAGYGIPIRMAVLFEARRALKEKETPPVKITAIRH